MIAAEVEIKIKIKPPADCTEGELQEWVLFHLRRQDSISLSNPLIGFGFNIHKTDIIIASKSKENGNTTSK